MHHYSLAIKHSVTRLNPGPFPAAADTSGGSRHGTWPSSVPDWRTVSSHSSSLHIVAGPWTRTGPSEPRGRSTAPMSHLDEHNNAFLNKTYL